MSAISAEALEAMEAVESTDRTSKYKIPNWLPAAVLLAVAVVWFGFVFISVAVMKQHELEMAQQTAEFVKAHLKGTRFETQ